MNTFRIAKFFESTLPCTGVLEIKLDLRGNVSEYLTDYSRITGCSYAIARPCHLAAAVAVGS